MCIVPSRRKKAILMPRFISFRDCRVKTKNAQWNRVEYWEIIADNLSKSGWSWG
jgi:hypothetical protein